MAFKTIIETGKTLKHNRFSGNVGMKILLRVSTVKFKLSLVLTQLGFACSKSTIKIPEQCVKSVQSQR